MELIICRTRRQIDEYISFMNSIYKENQYYRKSLMPVVKMMLKGKSVFCETAKIEPVMISQDGKITAVCTFISTHKMPHSLQLSFYEALPDSLEATALLVSAAKERCKKMGLTKLIIGINGHVNYGLGFLTDHFDTIPCFGSPYNPDYYNKYFSSMGFKEWSFVSYLTDLDSFDMDKEEKLLKRTQKKYSVRSADLRQLEREVKIYTYLNNVCFKNHPFYYERTFDEDYELLKDFKPLISGENVIIVEAGDEPVGFMLWYPDFNQLIPPRRGVGIDTILRHRLGMGKIDKFKIAEIGVIPKHQGTGAAALLFKKCMEMTKGKYKWCESSWIHSDNSRSRGFGIRWADYEYKHYKIYEMNV